MCKDIQHTCLKQNFDVLEINSEQNRDVRDIIEANIESSSVLGRDQDGDRTIDTETCIEIVEEEDSL